MSELEKDVDGWEYWIASNRKSRGRFGMDRTKSGSVTNTERVMACKSGDRTFGGWARGCGTERGEEGVVSLTTTPSDIDSGLYNKSLREI